MAEIRQDLAQLDHVILLLPYQDLLNPPSWLTSNFIVSPGGLHADGKTENRLVFFEDGTYLELIAFINDDPVRRQGHWWDKDFGVVDFALTSPDGVDYQGLQRRLQASQSGVSYDKPVNGGRLTPDGHELQWQVTFPRGVERGCVPFWCVDVTKREWRVPTTRANTSHPCGALGMGGVQIEADQHLTSRITTATAAIVDHEESRAPFRLDVPFPIQEVSEPTIRIATVGDNCLKGCRLSLILRTRGSKPKDIHKTVGDGTISIHFES